MNIGHLINNGKAAATILALVGLLFVSRPAGATTLIYKNFDDLVSEAEAIVVGTVRQAEAHYGPGKAICTFVTLTDLQVIHGDYKTNAMTLRLEGGIVEGHGQELVGSPIFEQGKRIIIFLNGNGKRAVPIVGWTQGVFRITSDTAATEDMITDYAGNRIFGVENNDLVKEHSRSKETGAEAADTSSTGITEKGTIPETVSAYPQSPSTEPWSASAFIDAIKDRVASKQKPGSAVNSMSVMDFSNLQYLRGNRKE
jgi:hypothetical protein